MEMNKHNYDPDTPNPRKRQSKHHVGIDNKEVTANPIDKLPDDLLTAILSCMSIKDAVRSSVLSSRWRSLWMFAHGTLEFNDRDIITNGTKMKMYNFETLVNRVLKLHQGASVDCLIIRFCNKREENFSCSITKWVLFAMRKEVKRFDLDLSVPRGSRCTYDFPDLLRLLTTFPENKYLPLWQKSSSFARCLRSLSCFISLRSVRLVSVAIKDEVVRYVLDSCAYIEELCIRGSNATRDLEFVDPLPYLRVLELSECCNLQHLVVSVTSLVSCTYEGNKIGLPFEKVPKLTELTLGGAFCESFVYEPNKHSSYSTQLVKLVLNLQTVSVGIQIGPLDSPQLYALKRLELSIMSQVGRSLLFFISLIKASPELREFKIKINYLVPCSSITDVLSLIPFPEVTSVEANVFGHKNLKVVEMDGYCGCASEDEFIVQVCKIADKSLETVVIDTDCDYYRDHPKYKLLLVMYKPREDGKVPMMKGVEKGKTSHKEPTENGQMNQFDAKKHAERFAFGFPSFAIKFVVR